jgi:DNA repair exonuclease SbcCD nuclease subunit
VIEDVVVAHSSDLHIGSDRGDHGIGGLRAVVASASDAGAQVLLLAGDVFDHSRVAGGLLESFAGVLGEAPFRTVILPGNHDPLIEESPYRRLPAIASLDVLGLDAPSVEFAELGLTVRGKAHPSYDDMHPLPEPNGAHAASGRTIVVAHGHYVSGASDLHRAWLIRDEDIAALDADYVALGHWDRRERVGRAPSYAYYSGSPDLAKSINVVRMRGDAPAVVSVRSLADGSEAVA